MNGFPKVLILVCLLAAQALADEPVAQPAPQDAAPAAEAPQQPSAPVAKPTKRKGRVAREKEAEGTEAIDRIKEDPVIKSPYKLNGQSLEVDPD